MNARILVVEDDERSMRLVRRVLSMDGHDVVCSVSGADAVRELQRRRPDLVLMDIQLPDANGVDLLGWIRGQPMLATLPVIAMTASVMPADTGRVAEAGFDAMFHKPLERIEDLQRAVSSLLARQPE